MNWPNSWYCCCRCLSCQCREECLEAEDETGLLWEKQKKRSSICMGKREAMAIEGAALLGRSFKDGSKAR